MRGFMIRDLLKRNGEDKRCFYIVLVVMNTFHMASDFMIFFLSQLIILYSESLFGSLNGSLSILILTNLHSIGSKLYLMEISGYHNEIYND